MNINVFVYKSLSKLIRFIKNKIDRMICFIHLVGNGVNFKEFRSSGVPYIMLARGGMLSIGKNFSMNNKIEGNPIGCYSKCTFFVDKGAKLTIGDNVGLSQTAIICHKQISIGNDVKIGGGVKIYDTDFHSLDPIIRTSKEDMHYKAVAPVIIKDKVFVGAYSIILKGVTIGENSIVGAGSVVPKSIPKNEIWAGNPAKFIRSL
nr:galactoside O-acetyltransferase [uncultured bacterium]